MAELTCGQGGSNGSQIINQINDNTEALALLNILAQVDPRGSLRLAAEATQTITDNSIPVLLGCFDTIVTSQNGLEPTLEGDNKATIKNTTDSTIKAILSIGLNVDFPANETLELYAYVNGVAYSSLPLIVQGNGTDKPISAYWESEVILNADDVVDLRGRNADTGSYDITYLRSTFRLTASWREIAPLPVQPVPIP